MKLNVHSPNKAFDAAFLKHRPLRSEMDLFKNNLIRLLGKIDEIEREENQKNHIRDFLRDTFYKNTNEINTKGSQDLVIHTGKDNKTNVGVIIEAKRPSNSAEMLSAEKPNAKALQELVLYYLRERIEEKNIDIKYCIATNINEWYIFDASWFEKLFYQNKAFVKQYEEWRDGKKVTKDTTLFYNDIAKPFIESIDLEIPCTYFNIHSYEKNLKNTDKQDDKPLIALLKVLSPFHLLKVPFADDSNKLKESFYKELLHIIGLEEATDGGKTIIRRKKDKRNPGSLIENAITSLETEDPLHKVPDAASFGFEKEERIFNIALELCITWINRILFLKLLEGQLVNYHRSPESGGKGNREFRFLNSEMINDFDELFKLFHRVLARENKDRDESIKQKYVRVPYLNSSLFEISDLEDQTIRINSLDNSAQLDLISSTVLKEAKKKNEKLPVLDYLFKFLDAFDFASEGTEDIEEDSKTLINASVLGKVFEKINGYKDGSIFTPGFITMYMCRQSIRLAVIQKFTEAYKWNITEFSDLKNYLTDRKSSKDILEFNTVINSLHVCDPAVGSGHFLVSALNELIAIKSELGLLADDKGDRIRDYEIEIANDELIITDYNRAIFEYQVVNGKPLSKEAQRLQKTLFHEKQTIIENCLFGVDINPNSVKICRLRLWIELLKNAYYKETGGEVFNELETLPNIDINIKCNNSLISRFALDADLSKALKSIKYNIEAYRGFVNDYKNEKNRDVKRGLQKIIDAIKSDFRTEIYNNDPKVVSLSKKGGELYNMLNQQKLFELDAKEKKKFKEKKEKLEADIRKLTQEVEAIKSNAVYKNAFEWRFEFPEVLDDNGNFIGFDVVIGNPPYGVKPNKFEKENYDSRYKATNDIYTMFIELGTQITGTNGNINFITPITWLTGSKYINTRKLFIDKVSLSKAINLPYNIFSGVFVDTGIYFFEKKSLNESLVFEFNPKSKIQIDDLAKIEFKRLLRNSWSTKDDLKINLNEADNSIFSKLDAIETTLGNLSETARGILAEKSEYKTTISEDLKKVFTGNLNRYTIDESFSFIHYDDKLKEKPKSYNFFIGDRILVRRIISRQFRIMASFTDDEFVCKKDIYIIKLNGDLLNYKYILALLNSKLLSFYKTKNSGSAKKDDFTQITLGDIRQLPIPIIESANQQPFITIVDKIIEDKKEGKDTKALEEKIDTLVYKLYDLTEEEIKIVEGK